MWDSKRDTDIKNRLLDSVGEGEGGVIWENSFETYITISEIDDQFKVNAWEKALKAAALEQPRGMGWGGKGFWDGGTQVHLWLILVSVWQKPPQYCKVISLQLK